MLKTAGKWTAIFVLAAALLPVVAAGCSSNTSGGGSEVGSIEGTVKNTDGKPVPGLGVSIISGTAAFPEMLALTDADGHYRLSSINAGTFKLAVNDAAGEKVAEGSVRVDGGKTATLDFTVPNTAVGADLATAFPILIRIPERS